MTKYCVAYKGRHYALRYIYFGDEWGGPFWIASTLLQGMIWDEDRGYPSDEARVVDELIFFFIPAHWFKLSDEELRDMILPNL